MVDYIERSKNQQIVNSPYLPDAPGPLVMEAFQGVNTSTTRAGVPDDQVAWCDGFIPLDQRNLRTLYGVGTTIYTAVGTTVVFFTFANIAATPYCIIFLANGQVVAVNTDTGTPTTILMAGTITTPSMTTVGTSQWGSQYLIIVSDQTNGYWLWDGTNTFSAGTLSPTVSIVNAGVGYTAPITITAVGGHGSGASLTGTVNGSGQVINVSVVNPGSGYTAVDDGVVYAVVAPNPTAGSGGSITASINSGTLVSLSIVASGSGYGVNTSLVITHAGIGSTATALPIITSGSITGTSITYRGNGMGTPVTVTITDTVTSASILLDIMPFGIGGNAVETYQGRTWVADGPLIQYTGPGLVADFSTAVGGGNFTSNDSFLKVKFSRLVQSNGFLYLIADSSINYISGVQTTGTPPVTTFTNQNADPAIGTPYPMSVMLQGQNIMFANSVGVYVLNGARAMKASTPMDGVYGSVANFGGNQLSAAHATIFNREVWMELVRIVDPVSGSTVNKLLMWDGARKWWASEQNLTLTFINSQEINSVFTTYGTNGTIVAPLFSTASNGFVKTVQSKLWDTPGSYFSTKAPGRFWSLENYYSTVSTGISIVLDSMAEVRSTGVIVNNTNGYSVTGPTITGFWTTPPSAMSQQGVLNGFTMKTNAADMAIVSGMIDTKIVGYRG